MEQLLHEHERAALSNQLATLVDETIMKDVRAQSWRLGPSSLDALCDRKIWYNYRWTRTEVRDARMRRLLDHGKEEEVRMVAWLRNAGVDVREFDPEAKPDAFNKQYRVRGVGQHVGGYLDGICILPPQLQYMFELVLEMKSSKDGADFNNLCKPVAQGGGVRKVKLAHFKQMSYYGWKKGIRYGLYVCLNKNTDALHIEIVELDWAMAADDERRLTEIIMAHRPPTRISEASTNFNCRFCHHQPECHGGEAYEVNCRSCENCYPAEGGVFICALVGKDAVIPREVVAVGCRAYHQIGR